jgi:hypothetical protein
MKTKNCSVSKAFMYANPNVSWGLAIQDAIVYAIENAVNVVLVHNDKQYQILQQDLISCANEIKTSQP